ncbi:microtubule-associated tyrosine carboxypeptidase 1-like [Apostichopus japonicus]|uniref:microtubule-associated tyrosine carboxypeptidase 1-like n=1 Tax=Stichopus japonicus TaxID=307972 RepID=UPI003AB81631
MKKKLKKKDKSHPTSTCKKGIVIKSFDQTPSKYLGKGDPLNLEEEKCQFLCHGKIPDFKFKATERQLDLITSSKKCEIKHDLLPQATWILEKVKEKYGTGEGYLLHTYGQRIDSEQASEVLKGYMVENGVDGMMSVAWSKDLSCSGRMTWVGPCLKANKPDARKYRLMLKDSADNCFLREKGILCIADHEIGTHFIRSYNDGLQPWFSNRLKFGLQKLKSYSLQQTEEGLAALNTVLKARSKYLFYPALLYYTACKSEEMTFQELFEHLESYLLDSDVRWKLVMRVKRYLPDPNMKGGTGKDQCYFRGAVDILRKLDRIDFEVLYSGKVALEDLPRVRHSARLTSIKLPPFMKDKATYTSHLRKIALLNDIRASPMRSGRGGRRSAKKGTTDRRRSQSVSARRIVKTSDET